MAPEIGVQVDGVDLASGGEVGFGSTLVGTPVTHTFTVQNCGNCELTLSPLDASSFPDGFSLVTNVGATTLDPGATTTFTVQLDATAAGSFAGTIHLLSNDADEGSFDIGLDGTVTAPVITVPEIRIWSDSTELTSGDAVSFGPTLLGTTVTHTFTIQNTGDGDLLLSQLDPSVLPAGFTLVQGLGATTLHSTAVTTFVVRFDAATHGAFGGTLHVLSNDADEGSFDIGLSGTATSPQIQVFAGSTQLSAGDMLNFGSTPVATPVVETLTIHNAGDGDLAVSGFD